MLELDCEQKQYLESLSSSQVRYKIFSQLKRIFGFYCGLTVLVSCSFDNNFDYKSKLGQSNAIWVESKYFRGVRPSTGDSLKESDLLELSSRMKKNNIKYAYIFAGPFNEDGTLPAFSSSQIAKESVSYLNSSNPEVTVLPWVGGIEGETVFLGDTLWVQTAISSIHSMMDVLGLNAIHVDFEYVISGHSYLDNKYSGTSDITTDEYGVKFNDFFNYLRKSDASLFVSTVVVSTGRDCKSWKRKHSMSELSKLIADVNQISFLFFDTSISRQRVFNENCMSLVVDISELRAKNSSVEYLIAIGSFINHPSLRSFRDMSIENIDNSLMVIRTNALKLTTMSPVVDGIAIYCDWQMDNREWVDFYNGWAYVADLQ